ncbi:MAG: excinuclease ABC subunit UvrC [Bacteroidota bacterium]|nr:excinuclease ABC subunit UvrC [Bacteroidota bacterium]
MEIPFYTPEQINFLPNEPGVYKFYDQDRSLIYVGKAKSLRKRVTSYFNKTSSSDRKTRKMVSEIRTIEFTIVNSELDALLLENSLIKNQQPRYNILLKDDKTYPYLCLTKERFPRIYSTRSVNHAYGTYFGPYASVKAMYNVVDLIKHLYTIRTCRYTLSEDSVKQLKYKLCLEYHIGNCKGPCQDLQTEDEYNNDIEQVIHILKGNLSIVRNHFKNEMMKAAENMEFEKAQGYKEKTLLLDKFQAKSLVVNQNISDVDVFTIVSDEKIAFVNYLKVKNGAIIYTQSVEVKKKLDEKDEEILPLVIVELKERYKIQFNEIISNIDVLLPGTDFNFTIPKIGDKKKLIDLSIKNALYYKHERYNIGLNKKEERETRVLNKLQDDLQLKAMPVHIECFDNSNMQGTNPVASMVCFKNGKPSKKDYRHYNIKTVEGPDDFASMQEVTFRRYKRILEEKESLPDLIVIDGGKGQLSSACTALKELGIYGSIPIIGIAKRLEEIYFPEDPYPLHIDKKSESLMLLQRIRDEAHRFAITFHRNKRSKSSFNTQLESIKGFGKKTTDKLLMHFKSVKRIQNADPQEIISIIGKEKARILIDALGLKKEDSELLQ